jgi:hypothetical protein
MMKSSTSRLLRIVVALSISLLLVATVSSSASQQSGGATLRPSSDNAGVTTTVRDDRVSVQLKVLSTNYYQGEYGSQKSTGSSGSTLAVGETGSSAAAVGFFDEQGRDGGRLCMNGTGTREFDAPHVWNATYEVLPAELGKVSLRIDWSHLYAETRGQERQVAGDIRTITMKEGETHILDFVAIEPGQEDYCSANVSIAVTAKIAEDPEMKFEALEYDLWLRHTDSKGGVHDRQFRTIGGQGTLIEYRMLPLRFVAAESFYPNGAGIDSILEISGAVRGRLRADGSVDVKLDASRWIGIARQGMPRRGGVGDGGTKIFSVVPGETVSMVLPTPRGANCTTLQSSSSGTNLDTTPQENKHCVDSAEFYGNHQDEIILTVNPVR